MSGSLDFAGRVTRLKKGLGLKKHEIAERLGCSRTMLYHYEQGDPPPPAKVLAAIALMEVPLGLADEIRDEETFGKRSVVKEPGSEYLSEGQNWRERALDAEAKLAAMAHILWRQRPDDESNREG